MANLLGNIGAAVRGQQEYQTYLNEQKATKLRLKADEAKLSELEDLADQAKKQRARQPEIDQATLDYLASNGLGRIPPPPQGGMPDGAQAPAPGQTSVPMMQANQKPVQYNPNPQAPGAGVRMGWPPLQGPPPSQMAPQGPQMAAQGQQPQPPRVPLQPPPIPPYQTIGGQSAQPQQAQGIPPPPPQQTQGQPAPNSMSLKDAAQFIKARGITDPIAGLQILEKLTPYLNNEARQEAAMLKMQVASQDKQLALQEKGREADQRSRDYNISVEERRQAAKESSDIRKLIGLTMAGIAQQNADTKKASVGDGVGGKSMDEGGVEAAAWNYLLKGSNPPARGGMYQATMKKVSEIAKENNMSIQELTSASADVKTKLAAKRSFETRAQNMERAENQILAEIPVMEQAMKSLDLSKIPIFAKGGVAALRQMGDPRVTTLDQAAETVFNEFQGIITGNPGTLNVSDVQNAKHSYENAKTPQEMAAAIAGMKRIMANAKSALAKTRNDIMGDINNSFGSKSSVGNAKIFSSKEELQTAIKSGKIKKGDTFNDPSGNPHTVN